MRFVHAAAATITIGMFAGCARTTVHRVSGTQLRGTRVHSTPQEVTLRTRAPDKFRRRQLSKRGMMTLVRHTSPLAPQELPRRGGMALSAAGRSRPPTRVT